MKIRSHKVLHIDLETYSPVDLGGSSVYKYCEDAGFQILLLAFAYNDDPVQVIEMPTRKTMPAQVLQDILDPEITKVAHNASFERICLSHAFAEGAQHKYLDPEAWYCTMIHACELGLPASLKHCAEAIGCEKAKDSAGTLLINYFSKPCKPTKANGGRTRNMPEDDPEKWERFVFYNKRDVEVEQEIYNKLQRFPMPDEEWERYCIDQQINDFGVRLEMTMVNNLTAKYPLMVEAMKEECMAITGGINLNSIIQLKEWIYQQTGMQIETLNKATIEELLKDQTLPEDVRRVLELRQECGMSSLKKYVAMSKCVSDDGRVRGCFRFYGGRTGRWAGRLVQFQNMPSRISITDFDPARQCVLNNDFDMLEILYGSITEAAKALVRTVIVPSPGYKLAVADYSAIEARVIAWLAGEGWRMKAFAEGRDIYCESASTMFGVKVEKHGENAHLRKQGKVAELACIAKGQRVLTSQGLIPIEDVKTTMKLWDGKEWVQHDGVIYKGKRKVIEFDGLKATPDHLVYVEGKYDPIYFGKSAEIGAHYTMSGDGRRAIRVCEDHQPGKALDEKKQTWVERIVCTGTMSDLRGDQMDFEVQPDPWAIKRMPALQSAAESPCLAPEKIHRCQAEVHKPKRRKLSELWGERDQIQFSHGTRCLSVYARHLWNARHEYGAGQDRLEWKLRTRKSPLGDQGTKPGESPDLGNSRLESGRMAILTECGHSKAFSRNEPRGNHRGSEGCREKQKEKLAEYSEETDVYDILNSGPRHRYTVEGHLVHNCGYEGGVGALIAFGADKMGLDQDQMQEIVRKWRKASPHICRLWRRVNDAVMRCIKGENVNFRHGIRFVRKPGYVFVQLPSGRSMAYWMPAIKDGKITYQKHTGTKLQRVQTFGGKLVENIVQAIARDCLAVSLERVAKRTDFRIIAHVHDEIICEVPADRADESLQVLENLMAEPIEWAPGLILTADGFVSDYYKKD